MVKAWAQMLRCSGFTPKVEPRGLIMGSDKRVDIAVPLDDGTFLQMDFRTCDPLLKSNMPLSCSIPGHANNCGQIEKDRKFYDIIHAQGDQFVAICHEFPGRLGDSALALRNRCAAKFSTSLPQQTVFKGYWLPILHSIFAKGTADLILKHMPCYPAENPLSAFAPMSTLPVVHTIIPNPLLSQSV